MAWKYANLEERLLANSVLIHGECWEWIGARKAASYHFYGQLNIWQTGKTITRLAHRIAYEVFKGPIPEGHEIDHLCYNTLCINPAHLESKTRLDNLHNRRKRKR